MKTVSPVRLALVVGLLVFCAGSAKAAINSPFNATSLGSFQAYASPPSLVPVWINHLGVSVNAPFSFSSLVATQIVDFSPTLLVPPQPPSIGNGSFTFTGTGPDKLMGKYSGVLVPTSNPLVYNAPCSFTFTGGTGMFAGATGSGQLSTLILFSDSSMMGGSSSITWSGNITLVPEPQAYVLLASLGLAGLVLRRWRRS